MFYEINIWKNFWKCQRKNNDWEFFLTNIRLKSENFPGKYWNFPEQLFWREALGTTSSKVPIKTYPRKVDQSNVFSSIRTSTYKTWINSVMRGKMRQQSIMRQLPCYEFQNQRGPEFVKLILSILLNYQQEKWQKEAMMWTKKDIFYVRSAYF